jgi:hypothetical protein
MPENTSDPVAAALDEMEHRAGDERHDMGLADSDARASADDVPRLVGALKAVLALAGEWDGRGQDMDDGTGMTLTSIRANTLYGCAQQLRAAISGELLGEESGNE